MLRGVTTHASDLAKAIYTELRKHNLGQREKGFHGLCTCKRGYTTSLVCAVVPASPHAPVMRPAASSLAALLLLAVAAPMVLGGPLDTTPVNGPHPRNVKSVAQTSDLIKADILAIKADAINEVNAAVVSVGRMYSTVLPWPSTAPWASWGAHRVGWCMTHRARHLPCQGLARPPLAIGCVRLRRRPRARHRRGRTTRPSGAATT